MLIAVLVEYAVVSLIAFITYGVDKGKSIERAWRVPEKVLLGMGLLGGSAGALVAMNIFRHKTKHWYFWVVNVIGLIIQAGIAGYLFIIC